MNQKSTLILLLSSLLCVCVSAQALSTKEQVEEAIWNYINGRNNGNIELLNKAFHPASDLRYVRNDTLNIWTSEDYISRVRPGRKTEPEVRVVYVNIDGDAAQAKIEMEYPEFKFADYVNLLKINGVWQIAVKSFARIPTKPKRVLFVITSHEQMGDSDRKTGFHLGEVSHVYKPIHDAGYEIDFVSPKGGHTYMYGDDMNDAASRWMIQDPTAYYKLTHAMKPLVVDPTKYSVIYYVGGHGTMWDLPDNDQINKIASTIYENNGVVSAICHGPSGLVNLKLSNGKYLVDGKKMTSFTDDEEKAIRQDEVVPFLLESKLKERGAKFVGEVNWQKNIVVDGRLITGQNPASASELSSEIIQFLESE